MTTWQEIADRPNVAGVDEVGRGPLAGSVVAAAVVLDPDYPVAGLADSKKLTPKRRRQLAAQIKQQALAWSIAEASCQEIDQLNILQASLLAMQRAIAGLQKAPQWLLIDGNRCPDNLPCPALAVVKGDSQVAAISAASILAKVNRDQTMEALEALYPGYGFAQHKGYPTASHRAALAKLGPCPIHRLSYGPVKNLTL